MPNVKTGKRREKMVILKLFKLGKDKKSIVSSLLFKDQTKKTCWGRKGSQWLWILSFSEKESHFSLKYRAIRPSKVFGAKKKVVLHGEAHAWAPVLGSFIKLREVGVSSYLGFTLCLSAI